MYFALALFLIFIMEKHFYNEQHFNEYFFLQRIKNIFLIQHKVTIFNVYYAKIRLCFKNGNVAVSVVYILYQSECFEVYTLYCV